MSVSLVDWIAVDWGTSRLRAWAMKDGRAMAEASSDAGMGALDPDGFEPALLALIDDWLAPSGRTLVVACGMVGARQGWAEAPYLTAPCRPHDAGGFVAAPACDRRLDIRIAPGIKQSDPADVMRGEETQIAGLIAVDPEFDGVFCLPGTHSKWVRVSAGEVVGFRTFMTGELFALLAERSVLRHSVDAAADAPWDEAAFDAGVADAMARPEALSGRLFGLRAETLLEDLPATAARARLSGLLIGVELAAAKGWWLGQNLALIGEAPLAHRYGAALAAQGVSAPVRPTADATLAGLSAARRALMGATS